MAKNTNDDMTPEAAKAIEGQQKQAIESAEAKVEQAKMDLEAAKLALKVAKEENG